MIRNIKLERFYHHPPERLWRALTEPEWMGRWMMDSDFKPEVGHEFAFRTNPAPLMGFDGLLYGTVLEVDPPKRLVYSFKGGAMKHDTTVIWTLTERDGGTWLRLEHLGFTGLGDVFVSGIIEFGWRGMLRKLTPVLDTMQTKPTS